MVLPEMNIKQESEDFQHDFPDLAGPDYEFKVKVEFEATSEAEYEDWCVATSFSGTQAVNECKDESVPFENLIGYSEQRCTICCEQFSNNYSVIQHNLEHLEVQLVPINMYKNQCTSCKQCFINKSVLLKHVFSEHRKKKKEKVLIAGDKDFRVTKSLHQCKTCGKIQKYKNWHSHMNEVHSECKLTCVICKAQFKCGRYLRRHISKVHTVPKIPNKQEEKTKVPCAKVPCAKVPCAKVPCSQCDAVLLNKNALKTHVRNCHSEKVICSICNSVLKSQSYLNTHMGRVHYNDGKKHTCECGKSFKSPRYLKVHKKNAHNIRS